jgi:deazaflavin-dependent oxidoreductase (nitroreductase family)
MGLMQELGYEVRDANGFQRAMQRLASSRPGAWCFSKTLHLVDRPQFRLTKGRVTVPGIVAGLPVVMVTTTGRRSGEPRTSPLLAIPTDDDLAIIGSNFGQSNTPGWVHNLEADPRATVSYREREVPVVARRAADDEADETFTSAATVYPGYARYRERAAHREFRVFVLQPLAPTT